ncbi:hypothetical protein BJX65DRAFT_304537 [Aspergillus insuetus]
MWTAVEAIEQQPLRTEVVTILGIMAERHKVGDLRAHTIIPVMLISFVGPRHARNLLAHFNGDKLCIKISAMLPVAGDDNTNMNKLIRWWAGKAKPDVATNLPLEYADGVEDLPTSTPARS